MSEWISVKDRLPEPGPEVLCWYEYYASDDYNHPNFAYGLTFWYDDKWWGTLSFGTNAE